MGQEGMTKEGDDLEAASISNTTVANYLPAFASFNNCAANAKAFGILVIQGNLYSSQYTPQTMMKTTTTTTTTTDPEATMNNNDLPVQDSPDIGWYGQPEPATSRLSRCCSLARKGLWIIAAAVVIVVCLVVVVLVVVVYPGGSSSTLPTTANNSDGNKETAATTATGNLLGRQRFIMFRSKLGRVSEPAVFVNPNSPQSQALKWLVYQDETLSLPSTSTSTTSGSNRNASQLSEEDAWAEGDFQWRLTQRYALLVLSFSMNGAAWRGIAPWEAHVTLNECHPGFEGVECNQDTGEVNKVDLDFRKLSGRIPEEIGTYACDVAASTIQDILFVLWYRRGSGRVVHNISSIHSLTSCSANVLFVQSCSSTRIGLLTKLTYLDLSRNNLQGRIPYALFHRLSNLGTFGSVDHSRVAP